MCVWHFLAKYASAKLAYDRLQDARHARLFPDEKSAIHLQVLPCHWFTGNVRLLTRRILIMKRSLRRTGFDASVRYGGHHSLQEVEPYIFYFMSVDDFQRNIATGSLMEQISPLVASFNLEPSITLFVVGNSKTKLTTKVISIS